MPACMYDRQYARLIMSGLACPGTVWPGQLAIVHSCLVVCMPTWWHVCMRWCMYALCVCMGVDVCVCRNVCVLCLSMCVYEWPYTWLYICRARCMYACMCFLTYRCVLMYVCLCVFVCACVCPTAILFVLMRSRAFTSLFVFACVHVCLCVYARAHAVYVPVYTYTCMCVTACMYSSSIWLCAWFGVLIVVCWCGRMCVRVCVYVCVSCMDVGTSGCLPALSGLAWHVQQCYCMARPGHCAWLYASTTKPSILMHAFLHSCTRTFHARTHMWTRT